MPKPKQNSQPNPGMTWINATFHAEMKRRSGDSVGYHRFSRIARIALSKQK